MTHSLPHDIQFPAKGTRHQQEVITSLQSLQAQTPRIPHAPHSQRIGKDQAFEAQFLLQHFCHDPPGKRRRHALLRLQGWHLQVSHHDAPQSRTDDPTKRIQLHAIQPLACEREDWQSFMGINIRIAMTGKMLAHRKHTPRLQAARVSYHLACHLRRNFPERTGIDDGIVRINVDISHRGEIDLHAYLATLACHLSSVFIQEAIRANTPQHHITRERRSAFQTHGQSPLAIEGDKQRQLGQLLRFIGQLHLVLQQTSGKKQAAHLVLLHHFFQQIPIGLIDLGGNGINEKLPDTLLEAHRLHHRIDPMSTRLVLLQGGNQHRLLHGARNIRPLPPWTIPELSPESVWVKPPSLSRPKTVNTARSAR